MILRDEAERIAAVWAHRDSLRSGQEYTPHLDEFELGYVVWSTPPPNVPPVPGEELRTVIDRETGELSFWPSVPAQVVQQMYRDHRARRPPVPLTADPAVELRRNTTRLPTPGIAAHLTLQGRVHRAHGAKGEQELRHHRLVREYLAQLPAGHLVRGGERHAELIVLSDVLHEHDQRRTAAGQPPLTLDTARELLAGAQLEVFRVREPGDPVGGPAKHACESCIIALVHFAVLDWPELAWTEEHRPPPQTAPGPPRFSPQVPPDPHRFPPQVAHALVEAGWWPDFGDGVVARYQIAEVTGVAGLAHRHEPFPAAEQTLTAFPGLVSHRQGPGEQVWIRPFRVSPSAAAHTADTLADFAAVLGARLFPLGTEEDDSILAVDEHGRVFALDQAGEWFLGATIDQALTNLLLGHAVPRVGNDGTW
ncbi:YwqJ-like deaminase [Micromonospora pattaloongensis]|uniref:YwqJ-like deaminase n=1 Tax=Micromonospora pattaloongensis TaxID=405436 RepID=A0A1H3M632_9ACTN|nr:SUKH-3 domain-containing protein [Micromonospora pattaloongensis]SDY71728.1 YwqJ-like deaminase [Micromonospora pattaloongensis]